jgi:hypothetical protein
MLNNILTSARGLRFTSYNFRWLAYFIKNVRDVQVYNIPNGAA